MKRLIVDIDDVMSDATAQVINYCEKEFGVSISRAVLNGVHLHSPHNTHLNHFHRINTWNEIGGETFS